MKSIFKITALLGLSVVSVFSVAAQQDLLHNKTHFTYNYVEAGVLHNNQEHLSGVGVNGAFVLFPNLAVIGAVQHTQNNHQHFPQIRRFASVGAQYQRLLNKTAFARTDYLIHAQVEYKYARDKARGIRDNKEDTGLLVGAGLRSEVVDNVEVYGDFSLRFEEITTHLSKLTDMRINPITTIGARYYFTPHLQVGGQLKMVTGRTMYDDDDTISANVRYSF